MTSFGKYVPLIGITIILTACGGGETISTTPAASVPQTTAAVNRAPVISGTPATSVDEGTGYRFTPVASDPDGDTLSFSVENLPAWATFDSNSGRISGTPGSGDVGIHANIAISVSDGAATASLAPFSITVISVGSVQLGGQIGFSTTTQSVTEGDIVSLTLMRTNGAGQASVMYGTHGLTAKSSTTTGDDYQGFDPVPVTFADGETSKVVTVQTLDNNIQENAETFEVYLTSPSTGYVLSSNTVSTVTIIDNDAAQNQPPTISGNPQTTVTAGAAYSFTPSASDPDGDNLTFSATNLPSWLNFNSSTGALNGTPSDNDIGVSNNIQLSVTDGTESVTLAAFSITVEASTAQVAKGSINLSWTAPSSRTDGTALALSEINGYVIYIGTTRDNLAMQVDLNDNTATSFTINDLAVGTYYVALTTYDVDGISSSYSNVVQTSVTATN